MPFGIPIQIHKTQLYEFGEKFGDCTSLISIVAKEMEIDLNDIFKPETFFKKELCSEMKNLTMWFEENKKSVKKMQKENCKQVNKMFSRACK